MEKKTNFFDILKCEGHLVYNFHGISMLPLLRQGKDIVEIENKGNRCCKKGEVVLFVRDDGRFVLHRIIRKCHNDYWIIGDNCRHGERVREEQIIGILTAIKRNSRVIKVTDRRYKIYSYIWCKTYPVRFVLLSVNKLIYMIGHYLKTILNKWNA